MAVAATSTVLSDLDLRPGEFDLLTAHRAENVDNHDRFESNFEGVATATNRGQTEVVYPIHPRAQDRLDEFGVDVPDPIRTVEPLDFFDFLRLKSTTELAFTDSGGVQEETRILGTPCVTLRYGTERPETAFVGANCIAGRRPDAIVAGAEIMRSKSGDWSPPSATATPPSTSSTTSGSSDATARPTPRPASSYRSPRGATREPAPCY
jgi:UDP-N-acetylglucosamine 2-epimerase (non-hydrolysing)